MCDKVNMVLAQSLLSDIPDPSCSSLSHCAVTGDLECCVSKQNNSMTTSCSLITFFTQWTWPVSMCHTKSHSTQWFDVQLNGSQWKWLCSVIDGSQRHGTNTKRGNSALVLFCSCSSFSDTHLDLDFTTYCIHPHLDEIRRKVYQHSSTGDESWITCHQITQ